jgi:thiazole synthase
MPPKAPRDDSGSSPSSDPLVLGKRRFQSRLFVGTGKYPDFDTMARALEASGAEVVTVAIRRVDFAGDPQKNLLNFIPKHFVLLPNTAGCYSADDAIRVAHLGRELGISELVKLEVLGDQKTLLPDPVETIKATERLVKDGFTVLVYTSDDPIVARRLQDAGAASVMPAGAPIGSGQGILNPNNIRIILEEIEVPVIVDAGVGTASDVAIAFELGADGVLLNTGIALARDPVRMARAMRSAAVAGREAYLAGRIPKRLYANASSPSAGLVEGLGRPAAGRRTAP